MTTIDFIQTPRGLYNREVMSIHRNGGRIRTAVRVFLLGVLQAKAGTPCLFLSSISFAVILASTRKFDPL